jgi:hypothetical protein
MRHFKIVNFLKEVDISAIGVDMLHHVFQKIDVSVPVMIEPYRLVVPWPDEESRLLAPIRPFQPLVNDIYHNFSSKLFFKIINISQVWLSLGLTLVVMAPLLSALNSFYIRYINRRVRKNIVEFSSVMHNTTFLLSHLTNQGMFTNTTNHLFL